MPVSIITDSAAALEPDVAASYGIFVVPMQLEIAGRPISESDVTLEELVAHLDEGVSTSGPSPGAFAEALASVHGDDGVVIVTVGNRFSSTFRSACAGAAAAAESSRIRVVDTGTAAGAEGLVVIAAADEARRGGDLDAVEARARLAADNVHLAAAVEKLTYLVRGGRLPTSLASAGTRLGIHLLFELRRDGIHPMRPTLSSGAAADQILSSWRHSRVEGAALHVAALHALCREDAEHLLERVRAEVQPATELIGTFGPVMVAHTGPGVIGLAWWWEVPNRS